MTSEESRHFRDLVHNNFRHERPATTRRHSIMSSIESRRSSTGSRIQSLMMPIHNFLYLPCRIFPSSIGPYCALQQLLLCCEIRHICLVLIVFYKLMTDESRCISVKKGLPFCRRLVMTGDTSLKVLLSIYALYIAKTLLVIVISTVLSKSVMGFQKTSVVGCELYPIFFGFLEKNLTLQSP